MPLYLQPVLAHSALTQLDYASAGHTGFVPSVRTISPGTGLTGGGDLSADRTLTLANTAVAPGAYASANITVDAQGRLTAAASGSTSVSDSIYGAGWNGVGTIAPSKNAVYDKIELATIASQNSTMLWGGTTGGSGTAYTATLVPGISAYVAGQIFAVKVHADCGAAATINFNGVGASTIKRSTLSGAALVSLAVRDLFQNQIAIFVYDSANFVLLNPPAPAVGTYTPTLFNTTNVASSGAATGIYCRIDSDVIATLVVDVTPTLTAAAATVLGFSLPIASNIGASTDCRGVATASATAVAQEGIITGDAPNDRGFLNFAANVAGVNSFTGIFMYRII